ncbi:MAG: hypothetical protein U0271_24300 [Polyangiaceae bacterium]
MHHDDHRGGPHQGPHHHHHGPHEHGHHHHGPHHHGPPGPPPPPCCHGAHGGGPQGSEFLDLEISRVLYSEASALARDAVRDILREAIRERIRSRMGQELEAIARIAADELVDDVTANLGIERQISARRDERRRDTEERLRAVFGKAPPPREGEGG